MKDFEEEEYTPRILDIIKVAFYNDNPTETRLTELRKYAEINLRRILNIGSGSKFMLGHLLHNKNDAKTKLDALDYPRQKDLLKIVNQIKELGNDATHTERVKAFTPIEYQKVLDGIFDLIAYQFVDYFKEYPMKLTSPNNVMSNFSLLPPIIRLKTLNRLRDDEPNNIQILNRLILAIIKVYGKPIAYEWLNLNESILRSIQYPNTKEISDYISCCGVEISPGLIAFSIPLHQFNNVYDLLKHKVDANSTSINEQGKLYDSFETAIKYYHTRKSEDSNSEIKKLHSIMDFVYIGRREEEKK